MRNLILNILIATALLGCVSVKPVPQTVAAVHQGAPSWCDQWNTFGDEEGTVVSEHQRFMFHLGFFLTKSDRVAEAVKQDHPTFDEAIMTKVKTCYEENVPTLVNQLDRVCSAANDGPNQEKLVDKSLNAYISWCIKQSTTET
jgi:hypothetical protein